MDILQILLALGSLGIIGFVLFWFGVIFKVGPKITQNQIDKDPRFK
ncbi:MAG: hypothetical protein AAB729_03275 [Patescibacteria group bacterium]